VGGNYGPMESELDEGRLPGIAGLTDAEAAALREQKDWRQQLAEQGRPFVGVPAPALEGALAQVAGLSWEEFEPFVTKQIAAAWVRLEPELDAAGLTGTPSFSVGLELGHVLTILHKRGETYGEDVLALLGETGMVTLAVTKVMRLLWGYTHGQPFETRRDSWLDLAGYAILSLAIDDWLNRKER